MGNLHLFYYLLYLDDDIGVLLWYIIISIPATNI